MGLKDKAVEWVVRRELDNQRKKGTMLGKFWEFMNGKKLVVGTIITIVASIAAGLPVLLPAFGLEATQVAQVVGVATMIVGALHKLYKFAYKEEHQ